MIEPETTPEKLAYSVPEAAAATSLSEAYIWQLVAEGRVKSVKIGKRRIIPKSALVAFVEGMQ